MKRRVPIGLWAAVVLLPVLVGVIVYSLLPLTFGLCANAALEFASQ